MNAKEVIEFSKPSKNSDFVLKPCPFCGSEEIFYATHKRTVGMRYSVICMGCMAEIDIGWAQDKCTAKQFWNKRTES